MRLLSLAAITAAVSAGLLFVACSGSSGVTFPDASTSTDEGGQSSGNPPPVLGDSGQTDAGIVCGPCQDDPPRADCTTTDPCGCGPFTCPDAGAEEPCQWSAAVNTCGAGRYCQAPGCGAGKCVAIGTVENTSLNPRCGCDGNTYWNASIAAKSGMAIEKQGACNGGKAKTCSSFASPCAPGTTCELKVRNVQACPLNPIGDRVSGVCWVTPTTCAEVISPQNPATHVCGNAACPSECSAVKAGTVHYEPDNICPVAVR